MSGDDAKHNSLGLDEESATTYPASELTRPDPEAILNDEADPDTLLGMESESEGVRSKRVSAISAYGPSTPQLNGNASGSVENTPRQPAYGSATVLDTNELEDPAQDPEAELGVLRAQVMDLTNQVTGLNGKLVRSFERVSDLEDDLSDAQSTAFQHASRIQALEKERQEHLAALDTGLLVEKAHVSTEMQRMMERVIEETAQRGKAQSDKERIEAELDELSASLFNEANKMVAVERLARARAEEKVARMEERLKDTEGIMLEQQKILGDLQRRVERQRSDTSEAEDDDAAREKDVKGLLQPPALVRSLSQRSEHGRYGGSRRSSSPAIAMPGTHLLLNIVPFQEFTTFIQHLRKLRYQLAPFYNYPYHGPRASNSGTLTPTPSARHPHVGPSSPGLSQPSSPTIGAQNLPLSPSPFLAAGVGRHERYPLLPANAEQLVHLPSQMSLPFIKRAVEEDTDPCLRLDIAPGLNWLTRRQANTAILEGNLVIEPVFAGGSVPDADEVRAQNAHLAPAACSLCGMLVVNVPLPGLNNSAGSSSGGAGGTSSVPSNFSAATASWASTFTSAAGSASASLSAATGGSGSTNGTSTPRSSRPSLFSSLRLGGSSSSPSSKERTSASGSSHAHTSPDPTSSLAGQPGVVQDAADATAAGLQPPLAPAPAPLPVPTHIFRISEGANSRYLLCPHHCLQRLRAACTFWGYLRTLERAVVLEGKFAWDDTAPATEGNSAPTSSSSLSAVASGDNQNVREQGSKAAILPSPLRQSLDRTPPEQEASKATISAREDEAVSADVTVSAKEEAVSAGQDAVNGSTSEETSGNADSGKKDAAPGATQEGEKDGEKKDQKEDQKEGEKDGKKEAVEEVPSASAPSSVASELQGEHATDSIPRRDNEEALRDTSSATASVTELDDDDEGFADASSNPADNSPEASFRPLEKDTQNGATDSGVSSENPSPADGTSQDVAATVAGDAEEAKAGTEGPASEASVKAVEEPASAGLLAPAPTLPEKAPPPVPRRSAARATRPVPAPPSRSGAASPTPPALPPRRGSPARGGAPLSPNPSQSQPQTPQAPAARLTLPLSGAGTAAGVSEPGMVWEERVWTEVVKLKEEMWRCRIGMRSGTGSEG